MLGLESISKTNPLLAYFFMGQIFLFCTALLVGGLLLLKRLVKKQGFEGDPAFDNERIATEIHQEVLKLQDLRNRLHPAFAGTGGAEVVVKAASTEGEAVDKEALEKEISGRFEKMISDLEEELKKAKEAVALAGSVVAPQEGAAAAPAAIPEGYLSPDQVKAEIEKAQASSAELIKKAEDSVNQVAHLEKILSEYKVFEEDFALVKKYKAENEELRKQLSAMGVNIPASPELSKTPVVAAPLEAAGAGETPAVTAAAPETPETTSASPSEASEKQVIKGDPLPAAEPALKISGDASPPVEAKTIETQPPQPSEQDLSALFEDLKKKPEESVEAAQAAPAATPSTVTPDIKESLDSGDAEAAAEAGGGDDNLMAEFEKLLSGNNNEAKS